VGDEPPCPRFGVERVGRFHSLLQADPAHRSFHCRVDYGPEPNRHSLYV